MELVTNVSSLAEHAHISRAHPTPKVGSRVVEKTLRSAVANAEHNNDMDVAKLFISEIFVDQDSTMKRDRKSTRLNSSHSDRSRMPSSA